MVFFSFSFVLKNTNYLRIWPKSGDRWNLDENGNEEDKKIRNKGAVPSIVIKSHAQDITKVLLKQWITESCRLSRLFFFSFLVLFSKHHWCPPGSRVFSLPTIRSCSETKTTKTGIWRSKICETEWWTNGRADDVSLLFGLEIFIQHWKPMLNTHMVQALSASPRRLSANNPSALNAVSLWITWGREGGHF